MDIKNGEEGSCSINPVPIKEFSMTDATSALA
jgi:hypothetical protein